MTVFLIICFTLISTIFGYLRIKYAYWDYRGVRQLKTNSIYGNFFKMNAVHLSDMLQEIYDKFRGHVALVGTYVYTKPVAVVLDLDLAKHILIKDFNKFTDRHRDIGLENIFTQNLFSLRGDKWRTMRSKLSPTFTSGKMKGMFETILKVAKEFELSFAQELKLSNDNIIEVYDMMGRFTTDVICSCAFGIECNCLKDKDAEFRNIGRTILSSRPPRLQILIFTYPLVRRIMRLLNRTAVLENFIKRIVNETVQEREAKNIKRNDFMNLLIDMKNTKDENGNDMLSLKEVAAHVFVFFVAGFETSSSTLSYCLFELAKNQHVQDKLRAEIVRVLNQHDSALTYEVMMEMSYLDQVITETLRMYPALGHLVRFAVADYEVPNMDVTIEKGIEVKIPIRAIHYDPDIYEEPFEFRPERFAPAEEQKRHPIAFLGFGDGPRNCIGLRFGRMQIKVGLITLLTRYKFFLCHKTPTVIPSAKRSMILAPIGGVYLKAEPLN